MLTCKVALWLDNSIAPCNLMIDDLSDAYIDKYSNTEKNDWGYMTDKVGSSFHFLRCKLLDKYPFIKITFFVPYLKHSVISEDAGLNIKKYNVGERNEFSAFLSLLRNIGHEIAHHGSNHGVYDGNGLWHQEWELFDEVATGVAVTTEGKNIFEKYIDYKILGGKYCGYKYNDISDEIIYKSKFLYWCKDANFFVASHGDLLVGKTIAFPTTIPGNIFVKYKYKTEVLKKDLVKKILALFHFVPDYFNKKRICSLVEKRSILSIQEHFSPSTTRGLVQSANIHSDIKSLDKIFNLLSNYDIWYATCSDISKYIYIRKNVTVDLSESRLMVYYEDEGLVGNFFITLIFNDEVVLMKDNVRHSCIKKGNEFVLTVPVAPGVNLFSIFNGAL